MLFCTTQWRSSTQTIYLIEVKGSSYPGKPYAIVTDVLTKRTLDIQVTEGDFSGGRREVGSEVPGRDTQLEPARCLHHPVGVRFGSNAWSVSARVKSIRVKLISNSELYQFKACIRDQGNGVEWIPGEWWRSNLSISIAVGCTQILLSGRVRRLPQLMSVCARCVCSFYVSPSLSMVCCLS